MAPVKLRRLSCYLKKKIENLHTQGIPAAGIRKHILAHDDYLVTSKSIKLYLRRRAVELESGIPTPKRRLQPEKRKLQSEHLKFIDTVIEQNDETTAPEIQKMLEEHFQIKVSISTIKRGRSKLGWTAANSRYCQIVRDVNKEKRKHYCLSVLQKNENFDDVIFSDESTIRMQSHVKLCFRRRGHRRRLKGIPKHPYQVHVWAGISRRGATKIAIFTGRLVSSGYQDILQKFLLPFTRRVYPDGYRLYQDNDPKHTSKSTAAWMRENQVETVSAPPESPDLNPIELIWAGLKYHLRKHVCPRTKDELVNGIISYWENLQPETINKYVDHLYKVVPKVIAMDGAASGF